MNIDPVLFEPKVLTEIESGNLPRAQEMLRGRFRKGLYNRKLLEAYGVLLLASGQSKDAGAYLFASGVRKPEYKASIAQFAQSNHVLDVQQLKSQLPMMVRHNSEEFFARIASEDFLERGFGPDELEKLDAKVEEIGLRSGNIGCLWSIVLIAIVTLWLLS